jgi:hypothetical protein
MRLTQSAMSSQSTMGCRRQSSIRVTPEKPCSRPRCRSGVAPQDLEEFSFRRAVGVLQGGVEPGRLTPRPARPKKP